MTAVLLILIPLLTGIASFAIKSESGSKNFALLSAVITLAISLVAVYNNTTITADVAWLPELGSRFSLMVDGMSKMLCLLTAISLPVVFVATYKNTYDKSGSFYGLMLLLQAGLMGVFLASDCLLFYFFWELALIPAYFLCSIWGGEKRIQVTFKFFVYTFVGSLLMLIGILYLYFKTPDHSFSLQSFYNLRLGSGEEAFVFWMFFIAFAIKMPIFPLHTWQPDTYQQAPTAVTMILSGVMVKMGLYGVIRWLLPVCPHAADKFSHIIIILSVIGIIYASLIAIKQDDIKKLIAYSSIAHIGLMSAAIFSNQPTGMQGLMIQMFNHGVNVIGMWIVADAIEQQTGTRLFSRLGGAAQFTPKLAMLFFVMALANISLPLTNAFVGEFLMFNALFNYNIWIAVVAGISIILVAVYTLNMMQKIFLGNAGATTKNIQEVNSGVQLALVILIIMVLLFGIYPQPMLQLTNNTIGLLTNNTLVH